MRRKPDAPLRRAALSATDRDFVELSRAMPEPTPPMSDGFVAVTQAPGEGAGAPEASTAPPNDRRRAPPVIATPLVASALLALAGTWPVLPDTPWRTLWAALSALAMTATGLLAAAAARARDDAAAAHGFTLTCARLGVVALAAIAAAPWLPGVAGTMAPLVLTIGLGAVSIAATATFGALSAQAAWAALLPLSPVAAVMADMPAAQGPLLGVAAIAALACAGALATGWACRRRWLHDARVARALRAHAGALRAERDVAMRAQERLREQLTAAIVELRQPVNALGLFSVALESRLSSGGEDWQARNMLQAIASLERSLAALSASERETGASERVALQDVFGRVVERYAGAAAEAGLSLRATAGSKEAFADAQLLESLLGCLVGHALTATASGGVRLVARRHGGHIHVDVSDTDAGAAPDEVAGHFSELPSGPHAALATAKRLAEQSRWALSVASRRGHGTTFRVDVPDATAAARALDAQDTTGLRARRAPSPATLRTIGRFLAPRSGTRAPVRH